MAGSTMEHRNAGHPRGGRAPAARLAGTLLVGAAAALGPGSAAYANPITFTERVPAADSGTGSVSASGSLGTLQFGPLASDCTPTNPPSHGNVVLTFWFYGDTVDVLPFTSPVAGAEILKGNAFVRVEDAATRMLLAQGQFVAADGIFVSADDTNFGVGFGSNGAAPGTSGFPGQVAYPYAQRKTSAPMTLQSDVDITGFATSCVNFPGSCGVPLHLATTAGDLVLCPVTLTSDDHQTGRFTARTGPPVYFLAFSRLSFDIVRGATAAVRANFQLAPVSDGIDPVAEGVTIAFGTSTLDVPLKLQIPPGSFQRSRNGSYVFEGAVGGVPVDARLAPQGGGWSFQLETSGPLIGLAGEVTVGLTIGNDTGTAPAAVNDDD